MDVLQEQDTGRVQAVVATLGVVDLDGDRVMPGCIDGPCRVTLSDWEHASWSAGSPPIGVGECYIDGDYLVFDGEFFGTERAQAARNMIRDLGDRCEWSWGFLVDQESVDHEGNRCLDKVTIYEVSPVMRAAGVSTGTRFIKSTRTAKQLERKGSLAGHTATAHREVTAWVEREQRRRGFPDGPSLSEIRRNLARNSVGDVNHRYSPGELATERAETRRQSDEQRLIRSIHDQQQQLQRRARLEELRKLRADLDAQLRRADNSNDSTTEKSGQQMNRQTGTPPEQQQAEKPSEASSPEEVDARVRQIVASLVAELAKLEKLLGGGETDEVDPDATKYDRDDYNEYQRNYQQDLSSSQRRDRYESQQRYVEDNIRA